MWGWSPSNRTYLEKVGRQQLCPTRGWLILVAGHTGTLILEFPVSSTIKKIHVFYIFWTVAFCYSNLNTLRQKSTNKLGRVRMKAPTSSCEWGWSSCEWERRHWQACVSKGKATWAVGVSKYLPLSKISARSLVSLCMAHFWTPVW